MTEEKKKALAKKKEEKVAAPKKKEKPKAEAEKSPTKPETKAKAPAKEESPKKEEPKKGEPKKGEPKKGEEKEEEKKIIKESVHTINLRKAFDCPRTSRVKYAAREVKNYIKKHTRKEPIVDPSVNEALWAKGIQNPPRRIKVKIQEEEKRATAVLA